MGEYSELYKIYDAVKYPALRTAIAEEFDRRYRGLSEDKTEALRAVLVQFKLLPDPAIARMEEGAAEYEDIFAAQDLMGL